MSLQWLKIKTTLNLGVSLSFTNIDQSQIQEYIPSQLGLCHENKSPISCFTAFKQSKNVNE